MKYFNILTLLLISSVLSFYACNDNTEAVGKEARESLEGPGSAALPDATAANPPAAEPLQNADGVWHYICNNGCAGGGGKGENCGTCGSPLAHNLPLNLLKMQPVSGIIPVEMAAQAEPEQLLLVVLVAVPWLITPLITSRRQMC